MKSYSPKGFLRPLLFGGLVVGLLFAGGCGKDVDTFIPTNTVQLEGNIDRFFAAARKPIDRKIVTDISFPNPIVTSNKSVVVFQPGSLEYPNGFPVTGQVEISVRELLTRGDILLYGHSTTSRDQLLVSGGQFFVKAMKNGNPVSLVEGMPVRLLTNLKQGVPPNNRMELFYDVQENDLISGELLDPTWYEADGNPATWNNVSVTEWAAIADSQQIVTGYGYSCFSDELDWIQIGAHHQVSSQERVNFCVSLPGIFVDFNTAVFISFDRLPIVLRLKGDGLESSFCNSYMADRPVRLPKDEPVTVLAISEQGTDKYFFDFTKLTLEKGITLDMVPVESTLDDIVDVITTL